MSRVALAAASGILSFLSLLLLLSVLTLSGWTSAKREGFVDPASRFDPELGWAAVPNYRARIGDWGTVSTNADGFRSPELPADVAEKRMRDCIAGLGSAQGFLRRHFASVLDIRHIPVLIFKEDRGLENTLKVHNLLKQIGDEPK